MHACKKKKYYCDTDGRKSKSGWTLTSIPTQKVREEGPDLFRESLIPKLKTTTKNSASDKAGPGVVVHTFNPELRSQRQAADQLGDMRERGGGKGRERREKKEKR